MVAKQKAQRAMVAADRQWNGHEAAAGLIKPVTIAYALARGSA